MHSQIVVVLEQASKINHTFRKRFLYRVSTIFLIAINPYMLLKPYSWLYDTDKENNIQEAKNVTWWIIFLHVYSHIFSFNMAGNINICICIIWLCKGFTLCTIRTGKVPHSYTTLTPSRTKNRLFHTDGQGQTNTHTYITMQAHTFDLLPTKYCGTQSFLPRFVL